MNVVTFYEARDSVGSYKSVVCVVHTSQHIRLYTTWTHHIVHFQCRRSVVTILSIAVIAHKRETKSRFFVSYMSCCHSHETCIRMIPCSVNCTGLKGCLYLLVQGFYLGIASPILLQVDDYSSIAELLISTT